MNALRDESICFSYRLANYQMGLRNSYAQFGAVRKEGGDQERATTSCINHVQDLVQTVSNISYVKHSMELLEGMIVNSGTDDDLC